LFRTAELAAKLQLRAQPKTKNAKDYWDAIHFSVDIQNLQGLKVHFENLFNGEKLLSKYNCMQSHWDVTLLILAAGYMQLSAIYM
jgi:hypothetical protein